MRSLNRPHPGTLPGKLHALLAVGLLLACAWLPTVAEAGTAITLFKSYAGNINFVTTGNTLRANDNTVNACSLQSGLSGTGVNAGTSNGTFSGIPAGSTIVAAYLYYAGSGNTVDNIVTFNGTSVTADRTFTDTTVDPFFGGFKDVTAQVAGNGTYSFTGLAVTNVAGSTWCNDQTVLAGWALVVIYSNNSEAYRVVNIYDGFQAFQNSSITLTPANFKVPTPAISGSKFAVITWEGDNTLFGNETLSFNGTVLTDNCNGTNNQYNGTINTLICTGTAATDDVFYGVDIDTFSVDPYVAAGQTSATTFYQSGPDAVMLAAQIISITDAPVSDLSISKVHNGIFGYGDNDTYTLTVTNNGPTTTSGTTTVSDTLPAGETYVSATGTGWTCGAVGQVVTCTSTSAIANGANFGAITLTVAVASGAGTSLANTATVSVDPSDFDNDSGNNSSTDTVSNAANTLVHPDLSTSTKTVVNTGGGDAVVGSTLQYTITLNESAGVEASNVSVTDNIPANVSGFVASAVSVTGSTTLITNSSTNGGGSNGDGLVSISNITVPANGSVTIVFTVQVAAGTANCTVINNTGTATYAGGSPTTAMVTAPAITVAQSSCTASGSKILYVYDNTTAGLNAALSRIPQAANTGTAINLAINGTQDFTLTPVLAKSLKFANTPDAGNVTMTVRLVETATGGSAGTNRPTTVELRTAAGVSIATSGTVNVANGPTLFTYTITVPQDTVVAAGGALVLRLHNNSATRTISFSQKTAAQGASTISFNTPTVINVDSVTAYSAVYPSTTTPTGGVFLPGQTVFVCAVISDPFGSADTDPASGGTAPTITITDPNGTVQVNAAAMTKEAAANCAGTASTITEAFEYSYATTTASPTGFWTASVTGFEGTEGTVSHTANGSFDLDVPSLLIMKTASVATDPVEGATRAKAIPGATITYTILVQNNGRGPVDSGTLVISDPIPANTAMSLPAKPPFTFTNGATSSGLSVTSGSDANITYTDHSNATYTPICTRPCTDTNIGGFKITLAGSMNGKTGAGTPSFTITFNVVIQ